MTDSENSETKLLEISRGTHKLAQMINSLPKALNSDGRAKDRTRGGFDFEESLITLRNLEEVSRVMNEMKEKLEVDYRGSERFERPVSSSGSLCNRIDEVKKIIKESSYNSQHLRIVSSDKKNSNKKAPSVIAKLMGLRDLPSETHHDPIVKEKPSNCLLVQPRTTLDVKIPKGRKLPFTVKNTEQRTKLPANSIEVVKIKDSKNMSSFIDSSLFKPNDFNYHKDNQVKTTVIMTTRQPHCHDLRFDEVLAQENARMTNRQMLSRNFERKEEKKIERNKAKSSSTRIRKRREAAVKDNESKRPQIDGRRHGEKNDLKAILATTKSQIKLINTSAVRPDSRLATASSSETSFSRGGTAPSRRNLGFKEPVTRNSKKTTAAGTVRKSMDIKIISESTNYKDIEGTKRTRNLHVNAFPKQAEISCKPSNIENKRKDSNILCEVRVKYKVRESPTPQDSIQRLNNEKAITRRSCKVEEECIQQLLRSNQQFISKAQELFQLEIHAKCHQGKEHFFNNELIFGYANELMVRKKTQLALSNHLLLQNKFLASTAVFSLDQLVEEISYGADKLTSYSIICACASSKDGIYMRLERDLRCNDVVINSVWDSGWVNWICVEEADLLVGQVEEQILCRLVEEVVVDFLVYYNNNKKTL